MIALRNVNNYGRYHRLKRLRSADNRLSIAPVVRWPFKEGYTLVPLEIVPLLPTQMRMLHDSYMKAMVDLNDMQGA